MARPSAFRDLGAALLIVGGAIGAVFLWSGVWPPIVVIESSSMMHPENQTSYGNVGVIDPGDMVFVKAIDPNLNGGRGDVELLDGPGAKADRFGKTGDVIVYYRDGARVKANGLPETPIIHRAIAWATVKCPKDVDPVTKRCNDGNRTFEVEYRSRTLAFNATEGITIREIGLTAYKPLNSGYISKGDNPVTNQFADQAGLASQPTLPEWITGKARGEVPWFGLLKLALGDEVKNSPTRDVTAQYWVRIGNVYAPSELWVMLACSTFAIILVPLAWDVWRAARDRRELEAAFEPVRVGPPPRPRVRPAPPPDPTASGPRRVTRFEVVERG